VKENLNKRDEETKDKVKVNHLNIGSGRQAVGELNIDIAQASYLQELIHKRKVKITFMNRVVSTSKTVRLTVTIASKKKFLK
jgi:hypothetical protein